MLPDFIHEFDESWGELQPMLRSPLIVDLFTNILPNSTFSPNRELIFKPFLMPLQDIKVVIVSRRPYSKELANGYAFGIKETVKEQLYVTKSIEAEVERSVGTRVEGDDNDCVSGKWSTLEHWAKQGVFLLNLNLTTTIGGPDDEHQAAWRRFTQRVIYLISKRNPCIWMYWGGLEREASVFGNMMYATGYTRDNIDDIPNFPDFNYIFTAGHPVWQNSSFHGCDHFYLANRILAKNNKSQIIW